MNGFIIIFTLLFFIVSISFLEYIVDISFLGISFFGITFPLSDVQVGQHNFPTLMSTTTFPRLDVQVGHQNFPTVCCPNWTLELSHALLSNLDIRIFPRSISLVFQHMILPHSTNRNIHRQTKPNIAIVYKHLLFPTPTLDLTCSIYRWVSFDMY